MTMNPEDREELTGVLHKLRALRDRLAAQRDAAPEGSKSKADLRSYARRVETAQNSLKRALERDDGRP